MGEGVGPRTFRQERELVDQTLSLLTFAKVLFRMQIFHHLSLISSFFVCCLTEPFRSIVFDFYQ